MKFVDLYKQYLLIKPDIDKAIEGVIKRSSFILGEDITELEQRIAKYCGVKYAVGLNSGTDALIYSLRALKIHEGDEVITSPFSFFATAEAIMLENAKPVFVDIDPQTFNINPHLIEKKITKRTKAIIPVHLFGQPADMDPIMKIARRYNLFVIEDAAQAIGAQYKNKRVGSMGHVGCLSFFPAKNLGCYGDGGMIVTNQKIIADMIRKMINHGSIKRYYHEFVGDSSRLDNLQAAILNVKIRFIDRWNLYRRKIAKLYETLLDPQFIKAPVTLPKTKSVYQQYTVRIKNRDKIQQDLSKAGIPTAIHYPMAIHLQPACKNLGYKKGMFPISEQAANEVLSLPIYPELSNIEIRKIANNVNKLARKYAGKQN